MHIYQAYGLCIQSEVELHDLNSWVGIPDVTVRLDNLSQLDIKTLDCGDRVLGNLEEIGRFLIQNGREIIIDPVVGLEESRLSPTILGSAMAIILRQRGMLVLHASCVAIENQAIAFLGGSGWGKSTLAKAFHQAGYKILTDDVMAIQLDKQGPIVIPSFPQFKLSPEAATFFEVNPAHLSPLFPNSPKLSHPYSDSFQQMPLPLHQMYILAKGQQHKILRLSNQETFAEVVRHTRGINILTAPAFVQQHLHHCTSLIQSVSAYQLIRKPSLQDILQSVDLVEKNLNNSISETPILRSISAKSAHSIVTAT